MFLVGRTNFMIGFGQGAPSVTPLVPGWLLGTVVGTVPTPVARLVRS